MNKRNHCIHFDKHLLGRIISVSYTHLARHASCAYEKWKVLFTPAFRERERVYKYLELPNI